jgi:hypothetical protein
MIAGLCWELSCTNARFCLLSNVQVIPFVRSCWEGWYRDDADYRALLLRNNSICSAWPRVQYCIAPFGVTQSTQKSRPSTVNRNLTGTTHKHQHNTMYSFPDAATAAHASCTRRTARSVRDRQTTPTLQQPTHAPRHSASRSPNTCRIQH